MSHLGSVVADRPLLTVDETKYFGEPVAVVVAKSDAETRNAAARVRVKFEEQRGVYSLEEALADGALRVQDPALRPDSPFRNTNIHNEWRFRWGIRTKRQRRWKLRPNTPIPWRRILPSNPMFSSPPPLPTVA